MDFSTIITPTNITAVFTGITALAVFLISKRKIQILEERLKAKDDQINLLEQRLKLKDDQLEAISAPALSKRMKEMKDLVKIGKENIKDKTDNRTIEVKFDDVIHVNESISGKKQYVINPIPFRNKAIKMFSGNIDEFGDYLEEIDKIVDSYLNSEEVKKIISLYSDENELN